MSAPATEELTTDVIVIGAGPTGENVAQYAHEGGLDVVLVDAGLVGGECSYYACMPSKALLSPIAVSHTTAHLPGVSASAVQPEALLARRDDWVSHYDDTSQVSWATGIGVPVVRGHARLAGDRLVEVDADGERRLLHARKAVVIATGSVPQVPEALSGLLAWSSRDATGVREVPQRLVIVGGGVVGVEAATWMSALGSQVTMLVRGPGVLASMEPFAGQAVADALAAAGVDVRTGTSVVSARRDQPRDTGLGRVHGGTIELDVRTGEHTETLVADEVLLATGRRPALDGLGLEQLGVDPAATDGPGLPSWLHIIGDAAGTAPLTHMGKYAARVLGAELADTPQSAPPAAVPVPQVVFTDPQVAAVGLTERQAVARLGADQIVVSRVGVDSVAAGGLERDDAAGTAQLVVERATGRVLGATFVGPGTAELVHAATIAIVGEVPVSVLRHAVPAYPTLSELWLRLLENLPVELR